ncbi:HEPN domain-containing protein [Leuconostoc lactis]|uniref:HEPN domain-containing protein n=1 Tax=Leuconostoc lactis TaxID=1246 RepID=UPI00167A014A|nr:HEPN domain-containing protein [Leuconostoc lactis]GHC28278.1 hypothetical protein GCM10008913_15140 [Leuconostoc lactis KCTC 3528 = DSM 20202]
MQYLTVLAKYQQCQSQCSDAKKDFYTNIISYIERNEELLREIHQKFNNVHISEQANLLAQSQKDLIVIKFSSTIEIFVKQLLNIHFASQIDNTFIESFIDDVIIDAKGRNVHIEYVEEILKKFNSNTILKNMINSTEHSLTYAEFKTSLKSLKNNRNSVAHEGNAIVSTTIQDIEENYLKCLLFIIALDKILDDNFI